MNPVWLRAGLVVLASWTALPALWAALFPWEFYLWFPFPGHSFVSMLPPYNEHLVRDFGLALMPLVPVSIACVIRPIPVFVTAVVVGSLLFSFPHMIYHSLHIVRTDDLALQVFALWFPILLGAVLLYLNRKYALGLRSDQDRVHGR